MSSQARETLAIEVDAQTLSEARSLARTENRELGSLVEEALTEFLKRREQAGPRAHVMDTYAASHRQFGDLYRKLAV